MYPPLLSKSWKTDFRNARKNGLTKSATNKNSKVKKFYTISESVEDLSIQGIIGWLRFYIKFLSLHVLYASAFSGETPLWQRCDLVLGYFERLKGYLRATTNWLLSFERWLFNGYWTVSLLHDLILIIKLVIDLHCTPFIKPGIFIKPPVSH